MKAKSRLIILAVVVAVLVVFLAVPRAEHRLNLGGTMICFNALRAGDLDVYVEYTGTGLVNILDREMIADPDEAYQYVREVFEEEYGLIWLDPIGFNNSYTLTMRRGDAEEHGIETISDLADYIDEHNAEFHAGFDAEFIERSDGYPGLSEHYDFEIPGRVRQMDPGLMYRAARDGDVDVINAFTTDGRIPAYDLVVLEDDRNFFPPYFAAPLVRRDTLEQNPGLEQVLNMLAGRISDEMMQELNYRVDEDNEPARDVAADFLTGEGLIGPEVEPSMELETPVVVGSKHFTEQEILGNMLILLLEAHTNGGGI